MVWSSAIAFEPWGPRTTIFEDETTTDRPATSRFLSPRLYLNTGAAAIAYDCSGLYIETDFRASEKGAPRPRSASARPRANTG